MIVFSHSASAINVASASTSAARSASDVSSSVGVANAQQLSSPTAPTMMMPQASPPAPTYLPTYSLFPLAHFSRAHRSLVTPHQQLRYQRGSLGNSQPRARGCTSPVRLL